MMQLSVHDASQVIGALQVLLEAEGLLEGSAFGLPAAPLPPGSGPSIATAGSPPPVAGNSVHMHITALEAKGAPSPTIAAPSTANHAEDNATNNTNGNAVVVEVDEGSVPLPPAAVEQLWQHRQLLAAAHERRGVRFELLARRLCRAVTARMDEAIDTKMPVPKPPKTQKKGDIVAKASTSEEAKGSAEAPQPAAKESAKEKEADKSTTTGDGESAAGQVNTKVDTEEEERKKRETEEAIKKQKEKEERRKKEEAEEKRAAAEEKTRAAKAATLAQTKGCKALLKALRAARLAASLLEYLVERYSNASRQDPLFFVEAVLGGDALITATNRFQSLFAARAFLPEGVAFGDAAEGPLFPPSSLSPLLRGADACRIVGSASAGDFVRIQLLTRVLLSHLWFLIGTAAIVDPAAPLAFLSAEKSSAAAGSSPADASTEVKETSSAPSACPPLLLASLDVALRVGYIDAVARAAAMLLAEPRVEGAVAAATDLVERCLLVGMGPLRRWRGNRLSVGRGWVAVLTALASPSSSFAILVATHADFRLALLTLVSERLGDSAARGATVADVAILSACDHGAYLAVLGQLAAAGPAALAGSSFSRTLFVEEALSASLKAAVARQDKEREEKGELFSAEENGSDQSLRHLRLLLSVGMVSVVCGDPTTPRAAAASLAPTPASSELLARVESFVGGMALPCAPASPPLALWLLDAVLNGYLMCAAAAEGLNTQTKEQDSSPPASSPTRRRPSLSALALAMPPAAAVAMSIVHYAPLALALKHGAAAVPLSASSAGADNGSPASSGGGREHSEVAIANSSAASHSCGIGSQVAATLKAFAALLWAAGRESSAPTAGGPAASDEATALSRIGDILLRVGLPLMRHAAGADSRRQGGGSAAVDEEASSGAADTDDDGNDGDSNSPIGEEEGTALPTVLDCLTAVSFVASFPSKVAAKERRRLLEDLTKTLVAKASALERRAAAVSAKRIGASAAGVSGGAAVIAWAEASVAEVLGTMPFPQPQPLRKGGAPSLAHHLLASRMGTPLLALAQRQTVLAARGAALLRVWPPTAVAAITRCLPLLDGGGEEGESEGEGAEVAAYIGSLAHDVLTAPIRHRVPLAPLLMPTYVALFAPSPRRQSSTPKSSAANDGIISSRSNGKYPPLPKALAQYFAANVRLTAQALEQCPAGPMADAIRCCDETKAFIKTSGEREGGEVAGDLALAAAEGFTALKGELLLVQRLYENVAALLSAREGGGKQSPSATTEALVRRLPVYMNALLFLLLVNDPRAVARVCASIELIILRLLRGRQREQEFWMRHAERVIASSSLEATKTGLVEWWMALGEQLRRSAVSRL